MTDESFQQILLILQEGEVDFILIGGVAAIAQGAARVTYDIDVVYSREPKNVEKLVRCLEQHNPYLRGAPPGLPFRFDKETVLSGLNFKLTTDIGDLDLLGYVSGGGSFEDILKESETVEIFDVKLNCVNLECLIRLKKAAGRPKDFEAISELIALQEERDGHIK